MKLLKIYYEDGGLKDLDEMEAAEHMLDVFIDDVELFLDAKILGLSVKDVEKFERGEILKISYREEVIALED